MPLQDAGTRNDGNPPDVMMIGRAPVYFQVPRYVEYPLPFEHFHIYTQHFGNWDTNVDNIFSRIYGRDIAVRMTAWGDLRDRESIAIDRICARFGRHEVRAAFLKSVSYEKAF